MSSPIPDSTYAGLKMSSFGFLRFLAKIYTSPRSQGICSPVAAEPRWRPEKSVAPRLLREGRRAIDSRPSTQRGGTTGSAATAADAAEPPESGVGGEFFCRAGAVEAPGEDRGKRRLADKQSPLRCRQHAAS